MLGLGATNPFPFVMGGGDSVVEVEHEALLATLEKGFDIGSDTGLYAETYADAIAIAVIWACNQRLANQMVPERMLENLTVWEESCRLRPAIDDFDSVRRAKLAAKLRGLANNALGDIEQAMLKILGVNFVQVTQPDPANWITYWPGVNPGPPGFEWCSNRARVAVVMTPDGLDAETIAEKQGAVVSQLDGMCPAWMSFLVGVGNGFIVNIGIVGQTIL